MGGIDLNEEEVEHKIIKRVASVVFLGMARPQLKFYH